MTRATVGVVAAVVAATAIAGCGGSSAPAPRAVPSLTAVPTPTCPSVTPGPTPAGATAILQHIPFGLPMPSNVTPVAHQVTSGVDVVRFTTPTTLHDAVLFIVDRYPKAGYVIGRGDAEATEADAPWVHGTVRGLTRLAALQQCQTLWLIAATSTGGARGTSPLLSPHPTSTVTSPLPFG